MSCFPNYQRAFNEQVGAGFPHQLYIQKYSGDNWLSELGDLRGKTISSSLCRAENCDLWELIFHEMAPQNPEVIWCAHNTKLWQLLNFDVLEMFKEPSKEGIEDY